MVHVQKKISVGMDVVKFCTVNKWSFKTDNFEALIDILEGDEMQKFNIDSRNTGEEKEYLLNSLLGARQYCIKDPLSTLPRARIINKM